jgi:hypothetical protein
MALPRQDLLDQVAFTVLVNVGNSERFGQPSQFSERLALEVFSTMHINGQPGGGYGRTNKTQ